MSTSSKTSAAPNHLCVLVHGLWGHPDHLSYLSKTLSENHSEDQLHVLVTSQNTGNFTYDGIDTGGERVTREIEEKLDALEEAGNTVTKISIIGYSLGGLIARYAIGLLFSTGRLDRLEPVNFTTFATPHLGARKPRIAYASSLYNFLGSRTLSVSGRQMFLIDKFRDTGRPILSVLADPGTIFMRGLAKFKNRSIYANVINDRTVSYHTSMIVSTDPFVDVDALDIKYLDGTHKVILDPHHPVTLKDNRTPKDIYSRGRKLLDGLPLAAFFVLILPFGASLFLANAAVQSVQSARRIRAHETGKTGFDFGLYRIPLMVNEVQHATDRAINSLTRSQTNEYLPSTESKTSSDIEADSASDLSRESTMKSKRSRRNSKQVFPTLALHPDQFEMIENLDTLGLKKFAVHFKSATHSHAGIIVRMDASRFKDGKIVVDHWVQNFEV